MCNLCVRLCPIQGKYPGANPDKNLVPNSIRTRSQFHAAIVAVDVSKPASRELRSVLLRVNVTL